MDNTFRIADLPDGAKIHLMVTGETSGLYEISSTKDLRCAGCWKRKRFSQETFERVREIKQRS